MERIIARMSAASTSPTIRAIWDAYVEDARFRDIASVKSIVSHAKRIIAFAGDLTYEQLARNRNSRMREFIALRRTHLVKRKGQLRPTTDSTIDREIRNLQAAINFAAGADDDSPVRIPYAVKLLRPKANPPRSRVLSRAGADGGELKRLMKALKDKRTPAHTALSVQVALYTGQRKGAIHALRWEHVDFDEGVIYFSRTIGSHGVPWAEKTTKKARADKPMSAPLRALLTEAKARATCAAVIEWGGKPIADGSSAYKSLLRRANISDATFHDLRRTSATIVRQGLSLEKAAEHIADSIATTARVYAKADPRANLEAQDVIGAALAM